MFTDRVVLKLYAGKGGNGIVAWRREKYVPKGGPAGGNGGKGADIIFKANPQLLSLEDYRSKRIIKAENGRAGGPNNQQGKRGKDLILSVPVGTLIKDAKTGEIIHDLTQEDETYTLCKGGKGGLGNTFFKTSRQRAPNKCTEGKFGEEIEVELELKLIADIGLVGFPNAGKSTLISALTLVKVKIAPYPFTTLYPNLGLLEFEDFSRVLIADIPGIIQDAHKDKGLGISFLKHIERTSVLVFVIDIAAIDGRDPYKDFITLRKEITSYSKEMADKPFIVVLNKIDVENADEIAKKFQKKYSSTAPLFVISAQEEKGLEKLKQEMKKTVPVNFNL